MEIRDKREPDPIASLLALDTYVRWALMASEEVVGEKGMHIVLREAGLEHLINHYPPNEMSPGTKCSYGDYANLCAALLNFFGRAGKSMTMRIGRKTMDLAIEQQASLFGLDTLVKASRLLPLKAQLKAGLMFQISNLRKIGKMGGHEWKIRLEDQGDKFSVIDETCPYCAGKEADTPICWVYNGALIQSTLWLTGKEFIIEEVACRAMGAPACVWEIKKTPKN